METSQEVKEKIQIVGRFWAARQVTKEMTPKIIRLNNIYKPSRARPINPDSTHHFEINECRHLAPGEYVLSNK